FLVVVVSVIIFVVFINVQAQNGFVVWAEGGGCKRQLMYKPIVDGKVGEMKVVIEDSKISDCWVCISYDGVWIAYSHVDQAFSGKYGKCDYHNFGIWDIYIAKIDNGKILPATPIKIAHGYYPSWGEDAKYPDKPKTLYFTHHETKSIKKTTVSPDGKFTEPVEFQKIPEQGWGYGSAHIQMSPGGRYLAYRPKRIDVWDYKQNVKIKCDPPFDGCHPCWGPRSTFLIWAANHVCRIDDGKYTYLGRSVALGKYWYGISNDAYFDEGKIWIIGSPGCGQNGAGKTQFKEVDISNNQWKVGPGTMVGNGNSADIHIYGPDGPPKVEPTSVLPKSKLNNDLNFNVRVNVGTTGLNLIIESVEPAGVYSAELYDIKGMRKVFIGKTDNTRTVIPVQSFVNGVYIIRIKTDKGATQKTIRLVR
ncbi:MAG: T9SS type A sorting domain-containing protein, partial [Chitinispirillia bacterium]